MYYKTVNAVRHVAFEDLGLIAPLLKSRGYQIRYIDAGIDDLKSPDIQKADLLVILGGPLGVNDSEEFPFIKDELRLIEKRLTLEKPMLGLCLGSQLIARALGGRVYATNSKEIGWGPIKLTSAGQQSCLRHLGSDRTHVLHWHGDTFELPSGAKHLAYTNTFANQAFSYNKNVLGLQFHAEAAGSPLERWLIGHLHEIRSTEGIDISKIREDTESWSPLLIRGGQYCFNEWLNSSGL